MPHVQTMDFILFCAYLQKLFVYHFIMASCCLLNIIYIFIFAAKHRRKVETLQKKPRELPKQDASLTKSLKLLYRYAERAMLDGETISVDIEKAVFGVSKTVSISQEDIMQFMEMKEISATCMIVYMR